MASASLRGCAPKEPNTKLDNRSLDREKAVSHLHVLVHTDTRVPSGTDEAVLQHPRRLQRHTMGNFPYQLQDQVIPQPRSKTDDVVSMVAWCFCRDECGPWRTRKFIWDTCKEICKRHELTSDESTRRYSKPSKLESGIHRREAVLIQIEGRRGMPTRQSH